MNNISEHVTLVKLMDSLGNVNYEVSVVGKCILIQMEKIFDVDYLIVECYLCLF